MFVAGDLGGYFGLCLGGSAISLFEILDLVIYNAILKCAMRRKGSRHQSRAANGQNNDQNSVLTNDGDLALTPSRRWRPMYDSSSDGLQYSAQF
jgi:hypothetical protein